MPRYTYGGEHAQTYPQYLDAEKGTTLVAEPGESYDVAQVEGLTAPGVDDKGEPLFEDGAQVQVPVTLVMPPDDRWAEPKATKPRRTDVTPEEH